MLYRVLGTLAVGYDGQPLPIPGGVLRPLLTTLLVRRNRPVSANELVRVAWGDTPTQRVQLEKRISEIRALLHRIDRRSQLATLRGFGYQLNVAEDELDADRFDRLTMQAEAMRSQGRIDEEIALRHEALELWQGPHVAANSGDEQLATLGRSLEERRRRVAIRLFELEFGRRRHAGVLDLVAGLAADYPTDRRLCELLMIAYYRCGDRGSADQAYRAHERALGDELAVSPDPAVRDLNYAISNGDEPEIARCESAVVSAEVPVPPPRTPMATPRQLPPPPADFVGRVDAVAEALWLLRRTPRPAAPVLVVTGPGGAGKTALALHVAHQVAPSYVDGQLIADLRGSTDRPANPDELLATFLHALGVRSIPESSTDRVHLYRTLLADRGVLLVLDDAYDERQVRDLIPSGPGCAVLVTARSRLPDIDNAHHLPDVGVLEHKEAMELFTAVVARSRIDLSPDDPDLALLLSQCAGLPLALRLAAAQYVRDHPAPLTELVARLSRHGADAIEYRERNLASTLGAGFERLDAPARRLILGLGLSRLVEFELWTAAALLDGSGADPASALAALVDYHLVEPVGTARRYRFHALTRDYVNRRARREFSIDECSRMHAQVYGALLSLARLAHRTRVGGVFEVSHSSTPDWRPPPAVGLPVDEPSAWDWFERERTNIRAAAEHSAELGLTEVCWDLAFTAHDFYGIGRYFDDWCAVLTVALQACQAAGDTRGEALMLVGLGQPTLVQSRPASGVSGVSQLVRAVDLLAGAGDTHGLAIAQRTLANALRRRGQLAAPLELFTRALEHYDASGDALGRWQTLRFIGHTQLDRGEIRAALELLSHAQQLAEELGRPYPLAQSSYWTGQAHIAAGDAAAAEKAFGPLFETFDGDSGGTGLAYATHAHGQVSLHSGAVNRSVEQLRRAAALAGEAQDATLEGRVHLTLAIAYDRLGMAQRRIAALEHAAECFAGGAVYLEATALSTLADAQSAAGNEQAARAARRRVERLYADMRLPEADQIRRGGQY